MSNDLGSIDGAITATTQTADKSFVVDLHFDYVRPPLSMNQRLHWRKKAEITKDIRTATRLLAHRIPFLGNCEMSLVWNVTDRRIRDADNAIPTLKAMCDGIVDAGIVLDDRPEFMTKLMPTIVLLPKGSKASMVLTVRAI